MCAYVCECVCVKERASTYGCVFEERDQERDRTFLSLLIFPDIYLYKYHMFKSRFKFLFSNGFGNRPLNSLKCL